MKTTPRVELVSGTVIHVSSSFLLLLIRPLALEDLDSGRSRKTYISDQELEAEKEFA